MDYLPERVREAGVFAQSISAASYTAASIPSILTGRYPSSHGCWRFDDRLPIAPTIFDERHSYQADTIWTHLDVAEKPPIRMTRADSSRSLEELATESEGFVYVEHDKGGHSPYGHSFEEHSTPSFFNELDDPNRIPELYEQSVEMSVDRFYSMKQRLEDLDILDETLLVFTSDHGELLGERTYGGLYGHGRPLVPEVARVPVVFMGAGLPSGAEYETLTAGVDIAPTLLGALGVDAQPTDGCDLWRETPSADRTPRCEFWLEKSVRNQLVTVYRAMSKWSHDGGVVYQHPPRWARLAYALFAHLYSEPESRIVRDRLSISAFHNFINLYSAKVKRYGNPTNISVADLQDISSAASPTSAKAENYYNEEQLEKLGYLQ